MYFQNFRPVTKNSQNFLWYYLIIPSNLVNSFFTICLLIFYNRKNAINCEPTYSSHKWVNKSCSHTSSHVSDGQYKACRCSLLTWVTCQRQVSFCHAYWKIVKTLKVGSGKKINANTFGRVICYLQKYKNNIQASSTYDKKNRNKHF